MKRLTTLHDSNEAENEELNSIKNERLTTLHDSNEAENEELNSIKNEAFNHVAR